MASLRILELFCICICILNTILVCHGTLSEKLMNFEKLNNDDFQHKIHRRSVPGNPAANLHDRDITFFSHGQQFVMKLTQSKTIFDSSFSVVSVDRHGTEHPVEINTDYFYRGYVEGYPTSRVTAHLEDDGLMTASVEMGNETYIVEPMWRHVQEDPSHDVIVYKASDVKWNMTDTNDGRGGPPHVNTCGNKEVDVDETGEKNDDADNKERRRRSTCTKGGEKDTCKLHLVADYRFCRDVGRSDVKTTTYYMIQVIVQVNEIFRQTCFEGAGNGYGVAVKRVTVYCDGFTSKPGYNANIKWGVDRLLTEFSRTDWKDVCLSHLFTYQDFDNGVIGLAYVGNPRSNYGGICSVKTRDRRSIRKHNCGFTSYVNWGRRLTSVEANIVTAHEIGHNFGSRHDNPNSNECSPGSSAGNYIMYASSVTGERTNNNKFSKCSKTQIGAVINQRGGWGGCLEKGGGARCGNNIVEDGEQCDEGANRTCCTDDCKFVSGAVCSDTNSLCCQNCQISADKICRAAYTYGCQGETKCDGTSKDCPAESPKLTSGESCIMSLENRKGKCAADGCASVCGKTSEPCTLSGEDSCKVACRSKLGGPCRPVTPELREVDGVPCNATSGREGYCSEESGKCEEIQRDVKETFGNLFEDFTLDKAVKWMENNIVITILVFSLLIWVPSGIIVTIVDKIEDNKYEELKEAEEKENFTRERSSFKKKKGERRGGGNM